MILESFFVASIKSVESHCCKQKLRHVQLQKLLMNIGILILLRQRSFVNGTIYRKIR